MTGPRYLAFATAIATFVCLGYFWTSQIVSAWMLLAPLLLGGGLLIGVGLLPARSKRSKPMSVAGWALYVGLTIVAIALTTAAGIDSQARGVISLLLLVGAGGLMWSAFRKGPNRACSYHNYFDN